MWKLIKTPVVITAKWVVEMKHGRYWDAIWLLDPTAAQNQKNPQNTHNQNQQPNKSFQLFWIYTKISSFAENWR